MNAVSGSPLGLSAYPPQGGVDGSAQRPEPAVTTAAGSAGKLPPTAPEAVEPAPALDPSQVRDRINALIRDQVTAGLITSDQADVLRDVLSAPASSASDGTANAAPDSSGLAGVDTGNGATPTDTARPSPSETLASFIHQVQRSQSRTLGYGSGGAQTANLASSKLLDFNT